MHIYKTSIKTDITGMQTDKTLYCFYNSCVRNCNIALRSDKTCVRCKNTIYCVYNLCVCVHNSCVHFIKID